MNRLPDNNMSKVVIASSDYIAEQEPELTFNRNDKIIVLKQFDNGWWFGTLGNDDNHKEEGYFSIDYINIHDITGNVNQICFCYLPLKKREAQFNWKCKCCSREYSKTTPWYSCGTGKQCKYVKTSASSYMVCSSCFGTFDDSNDADNKYDIDSSDDTFIYKKMISTINIIS